MKRTGKMNNGMSTETPNPLSAIPIVSPEVEVKATPNGELHLRRTAPAGSNFARFTNNLLGLRQAALINLDQRGALFWNQINGQRSLSDIIVNLCREWGSDVDVTREAVLRYTQMLMKRGLIRLMVQAPTDGKGQASR